LIESHTYDAQYYTKRDELDNESASRLIMSWRIVLVLQGDHDMAKTVPPANVDDYIARFTPEVQVVLNKVRETVRAAAPDATEIISYQMPAFRQNGILIYFAAWKEHLGLYPPIAGDAAIEKAVAKYAGPKGNLQFPLDKPIPYTLIKRIVKLRVKQALEKAAGRPRRPIR
jgi:uncharacterized protein YdhG (YjbR/CyaY superfamily)